MLACPPAERAFMMREVADRLEERAEQQEEAEQNADQSRSPQQGGGVAAHNGAH